MENEYCLVEKNTLTRIFVFLSASGKLCNLYKTIIKFFAVLHCLQIQKNRAAFALPLPD